MYICMKEMGTKYLGLTIGNKYLVRYVVVQTDETDVRQPWSVDENPTPASTSWILPTCTALSVTERSLPVGLLLNDLLFNPFKTLHQNNSRHQIYPLICFFSRQRAVLFGFAPELEIDTPIGVGFGHCQVKHHNFNSPVGSSTRHFIPWRTHWTPQ